MDRTTTAKGHASWIRYVAVWLCLLGLTTVSFLLSRAHLGTAELSVALAIAMAKSLLVLVFFMHLVEHKFSNTMVVVASFAFVVLLVSLVTADVATRHTFPPTPIPPARPE